MWRYRPCRPQIVPEVLDVEGEVYVRGPSGRPLRILRVRRQFPPSFQRLGGAGAAQPQSQGSVMPANESGRKLMVVTIRLGSCCMIGRGSANDEVEPGKRRRSSEKGVDAVCCCLFLEECPTLAVLKFIGGLFFYCLPLLYPRKSERISPC